ncbi:MAG: hypothetical protein ACI9IP_000156 [Arcticibacterium sp.]|jgi:hypothetical protein
MNKIVRLFSVLALASTVAFVSCKGDKGDPGNVGPAGPTGQNGTNGTNGADGADGTNGTNGNANVQRFSNTVAVADWANVEVPGIGSASTSTWGGVAIASEVITADMAVLAYVVSGDNKYSLPISLSKEIDQSVESLQYSYKTGKVNVYYKNQTALFGGTTTYAPAGDMNFQFVVIQESIVAGMKAAGVALEDYDAVINYMGNSVQLPVAQ